MAATELLRFDLDDTGPLETRVAALEGRVARLEAALARLEGQSAGALPTLDVKTVKLPLLEVGPETRESMDRLGITASFAMLDAKVAEAAAREAALGSRQSFAGPVEIDASLIDRAFARPAPQRLDVVSHLEEFHPKIAERIASTWRTAELVEYLKRLIVDERGTRAGFAPEVMSELLLLSAILEAPEERDRWNANARAI